MPGRLALCLALPLLLLASWHLSTAVLHLVPESRFPSPLQVWWAARELVADGDYQRHLLASLRRVALGFASGSLAAVVVGLLVGLSRAAARALDPTLQAARSVPSLAWVPFLLLWFGIDEAPKIALVAIGAFFPVYLTLVDGLRRIDRRLVEVGRIYGVRLVPHLYLPATLPSLLTGLRLGLGQAWLFLVAAELIASTRGFGFLLVDGQNSSRPDLMLVAILSLAALGKASDALLRQGERWFLRWS